MPSCFWNFLSHSLVRDTLRQPTSKHTLTFTEMLFFPPSSHSAPALFSLSPSCWEFNLLDQPPPNCSSASCLAPDSIIWGILGSSCIDVWLAGEAWSSCGSYCSFVTKWGKRNALHSNLCGSALINNEVTVTYGNMQVCMRMSV